MAAVTICSDFGAQENKVWHCFHCFPIYLPWSDGPDAMIFVFWMLSFKPTFSRSLSEDPANLSWTPDPRILWDNKCVVSSMAPHSSTLAWKIPWTEEPGRLQFMGSLRVGHNWATSLSLFTFMHWRRKWQPTPVFLPGESQGQGSMVSCRLWGRTESVTTEAT